MASEPEPEVVLPIGAQKHDLAWKHCLMVRSAGRVRLKCMYCHKHFLCGGIHRFKEHLARHLGNACCCPKVPREVQETMLHSLDVVAAKKKRKQSLADDIRRTSHPTASPSGPDGDAGAAQVDGSGGGAEMESPIHMIPLNEVLDLGAVPLEETPPMTREMRGSISKKKKKVAARHASTPPLAPQTQQHLQPTPAHV